ncbi:MAG: hypothetical protein RR827_06925 [Oscillospiraceae bacterium]
MSQHNTRRPHIGFVKGFAIATLAAVTATLILLWLFLGDYQKNLPQNFAEKILKAYQTTDVQTIKKYSKDVSGSGGADEERANYYRENIKLDKLYFYKATEKKQGEIEYEFVAQGQEVATLTLGATGKKSGFGFPKYEIISLKECPLTEYCITAPYDVQLYIDGEIIDQQYITDEQVVVDNFVPIAQEEFKTSVYRIGDLPHIDTLSAVSEDGCECTVVWSEEHDSARVEKTVSDQQEKEILDFTIDFSQSYSMFATQQYGNRMATLSRVYPGTDFYNALLLYTNEWGESYTYDRFDNRVIDNIVRYSQTEFSCDIRFNYVIIFDDGTEKSYPYSMTYYLTKHTGQMLLVDMQSRG